MEITISTIKTNKVYTVLPCNPDIAKSITRKQFIDSVRIWAAGYFKNCHSVFAAVEEDLYSLAIILDINNDHEDFQHTIDIPVVDTI